MVQALYVIDIIWCEEKGKNNKVAPATMVAVDSYSFIDTATDDVSLSNMTRTSWNDEWVISVPDDETVNLPTLVDTSDSASTILAALRRGDLSHIKEYASKPTFTVDSVVYDDKTMLHFACIYGHVDIAQYLVQELHANLNAATNEKKTALHFAVHYKKEAIVRFLLEQEETDIRVKQRDGWTALHTAARQGQLEMVKL